MVANDLLWIWRCPTCGESGTTEQRPTFSRCLRCDQSAIRGVYPPPLEIVHGLRWLLEWTRELAILEVIQIVEETMEFSSETTGHGKAQRAFGRKLLEKLSDLESSELSALLAQRDNRK